MARTRGPSGRASGHGLLLGAAGIAVAMGAGCHVRGGNAPKVDAPVMRAPVEQAPTQALTQSESEEPRSASWQQYLVKDVRERYPTRARLARYGAVRYAVDGPVQAGASHTEALDAPELVVVERSASRGRFRTVMRAGDAPYQLLLWLEQADLHRVALRQVELEEWRSDDAFTGEERGATGGLGELVFTSGVTLYPGRVVTIRFRDDHRKRIQVAIWGDCLQAEGWLDHTDVGTYFTDVDVEIDRDSSREHAIFVSDPTALLDKPGGDRIAIFQGGCNARQVGAERQGYIPVAVRNDDWEARGWIPPQLNGWTSQCDFGGFYEGDRGGVAIEIPEGACLHDQRGGEVIGVAVDDVVEGGAEEHDGWWRFEFTSPWGPLPLWLEVDRAEAEHRRAAEERERERPATGRSRAEVGEIGGIGLRRGQVVPFTMCR